MARRQHVNDPPRPVEKYIPCSLFFKLKTEGPHETVVRKSQAKKSVVLVLDYVWGFECHILRNKSRCSY